jgi:hypothetical protein
MLAETRTPGTFAVPTSERTDRFGGVSDSMHKMLCKFDRCHDESVSEKDGEAKQKRKSRNGEHVNNHRAGGCDETTSWGEFFRRRG